MTTESTQAGGFPDRARRLAEDFADDCVTAGYVSTGAKSHAKFCDFLTTHASQQAAVVAGLEERVAQLMAELSGDRRLRGADHDDAKRYREFLVSGLPVCFLGRDYRSKAELDAAIDHAMKEPGHG